MTEQDKNREQKILSILDQETEEGAELAAEARKMIEYLLLEKKDTRRKIFRSVRRFAWISEKSSISSVDFLVTVDGKKAMVIKCAAGSLSSRERQAVAAAG